MPDPHYLAIWEFEVKAACAADFERIYGPDGLWAQLFRRSPEYLGTELVRDMGRAGRYLTVDRWTSREALQRFKRENANEYKALDDKCEQLTAAETLIGEFESVSPFQTAPPQRP